jgi:hypothetical protein
MCATLGASGGGLLSGARGAVAMVVAAWEGAQGNRGHGCRHPRRRGSPDPWGSDAYSLKRPLIRGDQM